MENTERNEFNKNGLDRASKSTETIAKHIKDELGTVAENVKKSSADAINQSGELAQKAYEQTSELARKAYDQVSDGSKDALKRIETEVKSSPMTALALAFGAGALCGIMCQKKSK